MVILLQTIAVIGIVMSLYLLYVRRRLVHDSSYKAVCDISEKMSCTKVAASKYSHLLGVPNAFIGLLFYAAVLVLSDIALTKIIFYLSIPAVLATIYLAYLMQFRVKNSCIVCYGTYIANILIFLLSM